MRALPVRPSSKLTRCAGIPVGRDHEQAAGPCSREQPELRGAGPEHEQALHTAIVASGRDGAALDGRPGKARTASMVGAAESVP